MDSIEGRKGWVSSEDWMKRQLSAVIFSVLVGFGAYAQQLQLRADAPHQYRVKTGDTLWDIAGLYLDKPWLWPQLWRLNPQVDNPNLIYPGDVLVLKFDAAGKPILAKSGSEQLLTETVASEQRTKTLDSGVIRLSPKVRKVRSDQAISLIPTSVLTPFLTGQQLKLAEQLEGAAYLLGASEPVKNAVAGHLMYVRGTLNDDTRYAVYRRAGDVTDPQSGNVLGVELQPVAQVKVLKEQAAAKDNMTRIQLTESHIEARQGDLVLPLRNESMLPSQLQLTMAPAIEPGQILSSGSRLREFARWELVLINRGSEQGLQPGHVVPVRRNSPTVLDQQPPRYPEDSDGWGKVVGAFDQSKMPAETVGQVLVLEAGAQFSYAIVLESQQPLRVGDWVGQQAGGQDVTANDQQITYHPGIERTKSQPVAHSVP